MADGQIEFEAQGKRWTLELTNRSELEIRKQSGRSMFQIMSSLDGMEDYLAIFAAGLRTHQKEITDDQAVDLVGPKRIRELVTQLLSATYGGNEENPPQPSEEVVTGSAS